MSTKPKVETDGLMALTGPTVAEDLTKCPYSGCLYEPTGKDTKNRRSHMKRHIETHGSERLLCIVAGCTKSFAGRRKDNLRMHLVKVHKMDRAEIDLDGVTLAETPVLSPSGAERDLLTKDWADQGGKAMSLETWPGHAGPPGSGGGSPDQFSLDGNYLM